MDFKAKIISTNSWFLISLWVVHFHYYHKIGTRIKLNRLKSFWPEINFDPQHNLGELLIKLFGNFLNWVLWTSNQIVVFSFTGVHHAFWVQIFKILWLLDMQLLLFLLYMPKPYGISVKDITVNWDPTLHMAIHERLQEASQDMNDFKGKCLWKFCKILLLVFLNLFARLCCHGKCNPKVYQRSGL